MIRQHPHITELLKLQEDIHRLVCELSGQMTMTSLDLSGNWVPNIDLSEDSTQLVVKAEVPGILPKDIQVSLHENFLHISGEKRQPAHRRKVHYLCLERNYGRFSRTICLNAVVNPDGVVARLHNGILSILLPKLQDRRRVPRIIPIGP